jgi:hypothetical protein
VARSWLEPLRHRAHALVEQPTKVPLDPAAGKCFIINNNSRHGGIRVNLAGREPEGKVQPGAEYEALLERLARSPRHQEHRNRQAHCQSRHPQDGSVPGRSGRALSRSFRGMGRGGPGARRAIGRIGRIDRSIRTAGPATMTRPACSSLRVPALLGPAGPRGFDLDFAPTFCDALGVACDEFDGTAIPEIAEPVKMRLAPGRAGAVAESRPHACIGGGAGTSACAGSRP